LPAKMMFGIAGLVLRQVFGCESQPDKLQMGVPEASRNIRPSSECEFLRSLVPNAQKQALHG
jgi:hypothetical protein